MKTLFFILIFSFSTGYWISAQQAAKSSSNKKEYFPLPDSVGGWRTLTDNKKIKRVTGIDKVKLDQAFDFVRSTTSNGGLLVLRHGWLVYENYFGKGLRDATPNLASCTKSFTSISVGILMSERPDLFPDGLDQKVYTTLLMPSEAFPLPDPRMADIKLGQLLSFSAGIRGNNPVYINGKRSTIDPVGPDGWESMVDEYSLGIKDGKMGSIPFTAKTLWCEPGGGYSYASASIHNASIMLRHVTGMELEDYIDSHLAKPLGWGRWGFGYKNQPLVTHTPGAGGIALRSTDMLRFCYMLLHEGRWGQQQIVPKEYVQKATKKSPYNPHYRYSFQFHTNTDGNISELPRDTFWKGGSGRHYFCIIPSLDLIVWKLGGGDGQYSFADTGLPEPLYTSEVTKPINDGQVHDESSDFIKIMTMVISSIVDEKK
ncbi:MAG: serine hydrolase [Bacteroidia bacterium]|nr:serine hydrolase [Bacteroidia bacterium]